MPEKLRSVNTKFWDDPFIDELDISQKLLFLYLLTNPLTNLLGVYEITLKRICSDTGLKNETILKGFERFGMVKKAFFINNYVILPNWLKNQSLNSNMKIAVSRQFLDLPKELKDNILGNGSEGFQNGSEGFRTILECLGKYEIEVESEVEVESENIKKKWKLNFEIYKSELKVAYDYLITDNEFISEQEKYNPNIDVKLTMEKSYVNFWNTEAGWKHKKQSRIKDIDWKATFVSAISNKMNIVYKQKKNEHAISTDNF